MAARALACFCLLAAAVGQAQTTQGLIAGRIVDSRTGRPVAGARVEYFNSATGASGTALSSGSGDYALPLLSPGAYRLRVIAADYQAQEVQELELAVAARLDLNFRMRPLSDVWEAGQYRSVFLPGTRTIVTFYGPDVDSSRSGSFEAARGVRGALESTVSDVIHPGLIRDLPLAGRDVYTMLLSQPAATADSGTARGIGLAIMGQRPESSNFLLDGLENNNYLTTGALAPVAPEAIQEYRVSTNNFSAEYGRTSGFIANAVSKSGGNDVHGILYAYLRNEALNANDFQRNLAGLGRAPAKERQMGFQVGGPVRRDRLFFSSAYEHLRSRGRGETQTFLLPTPEFTQFIQPVRQSRQLLERYPSPAPSTPGVFNIAMPFDPPVSVDRWLTIQRLDYQSADGRHRIMGRGAAAHVGRPDFIWTPYTEFSSGLGQDTWSIGVSHVWTLQPGLLNEFKIGRNRDDIGWDRAHPEVPTLVSGDGTLLPGSPALYAYRNDSHTWEILNSLVWTRGRHIVTTGGGFLNRRAEGYLTGGRDGYYQFGDNIFPGLIAFSLDRASLFRVAVDREPLPRFGIPGFDRQYRYNQGFFFLQDTFRATSRLTFNAGLRYERFGAPRNTGATKDMLVDFGAGGRLTAGGGGDQRLYEPDRNDWAGRFGFSYDLTGRGNTLLRGAYGIFHDRPYDNLWQNVRGNRAAIPIFLLTAFNTNFMEPVGDALQRYTSQLRAVEGADFPRLTTFNPNVRTPYAQTYFLGVQQRVGESWSVEVNGAGSLGRKLLVTDTLNRFRTLPTPEAPYGLIRSRDSQGLSNYQALTATARYRGRRHHFQASYTWSHAIDHQSDPLRGDFFDLIAATSGGLGSRGGEPAFSRVNNIRADRGSSDFDQRHNLVFLSVWELPRLFNGSLVGWLFRDWRVSQLAAFRSGFPFSVGAPATILTESILNNRADLVNPAATIRQPAPGGALLLDRAAFAAPAAGQLGNTGRNAFSGPGLYNIDASVARSFPLRWLGEAGRFTLRADMFNVLNHANLGPPEAFLTSPNFGVAAYGRKGRESGFPATTPLAETARQIQMILRLEF